MLGPIEIRRTSPGDRDTSYATVERDTSYEPGTCSRIVARDKGPEMLRAGSTVIPEPLAWHISPSDAN